jgi:hypothetical protein
MKREEAMKNLWTVFGRRGAVPLIHSPAFGSGDTAPNFFRFNALIGNGIPELSRSGPSPISCYLSFNSLNQC